MTKMTTGENTLKLISGILETICFYSVAPFLLVVIIAGKIIKCDSPGWSSIPIPVIDPAKEFLKNRKIAEENPDYLDIEEGLLVSDIYALGKLISQVAHQKMQVADVGSWKGKSSSILGAEAKQYNGHVYSIDTWQGNLGTWNYELAEKYSIKDIFKNNMRILKLSNTVKPITAKSEEAVDRFTDNSLDLVFLDADHRYVYIKKDIESWLPKLKDGGIICGHDCNKYYEDLTWWQKHKLNNNLDKDYINTIGHPGVIKAVYETFGDDYKIMTPSSIWFYKKNG